MSCNSDNKTPEPPKEESSGGFFSWLLGSGSSAPAAEDSSMCPGGCGMEKCNCNCALREHLKECCGFGTLPPLITKDTCPVPKRATVDASAAAQEECAFPPVNTTCQTSADINKGPPAFACSNKKDKGKCDLPETDVTTCIPAWICPPTKTNMRSYPAPVGVIILPISSKPRGQGNQGKPSVSKCGSCGTVSTEASAEPKVANKNCPMVRSRTCETKAPEGKSDGDSVFAKLGALFSGKAAEFEEICQKITAAADAEEEDCNCKDCVKDRKQELATKKMTSVRENFQKCSQCKGNVYSFQSPTDTFGDFKCPPGTEIKRAQPKGCEVLPPPVIEAEPETPPPPEMQPEQICPPMEAFRLCNQDSAPVQEKLEECECPPVEVSDQCVPVVETPAEECPPIQVSDPCAPIEDLPAPDCVEDIPQLEDEPPANTCEVPEETCCCCEEGDDPIEESPETSLQELSTSDNSVEVPETPGGECNENKDTCVCDDIVIEEAIIAETVQVDPCPVTKNICQSEQVEIEVIVLVQEEQKEVDPCTVLKSWEKIDPCACKESEKKEIPQVIETPLACSPPPAPEAVKAEECSPINPEPQIVKDCPPIIRAGPEVVIISGMEVQKPSKDMLDATCRCKACTEARGPQVVEQEGYQTPKSPCGRCGENRGENDSCSMCRFANNMRNSCPPKPDEVVVDETADEPCDCDRCTDPCNSDVFDLSPVGKPIYEGGMCMTRVGHFMWKLNAGAPSFKDLAFDGQKYNGYGVPGEEDEGMEMEMECTCEEHMKMMEEMKKKNKYEGGMELSNSQTYMWARAEPK